MSPSPSPPLPWSTIEALVEQALHDDRVMFDGPWPSVTLTFAQSLNGRIAGPQGQPLRLSGEESMAMTHQLRAQHDTILVGIGTVISDDPRLTTRICGPHYTLKNPQPVVIDPTLRMPLGCKLLTGPLADPTVKPPWIITSAQCSLERKALLEDAGARVFVLPGDLTMPTQSSIRPTIEVADILACLRRQGTQSLIVEGGATVIDHFLRFMSTVRRDLSPERHLPPLQE
ncbi:2,5-diamino-6-(ribosylamino)-4(3H)-pyrimidinone 5'-phosphate reductase [Dispira simplex]|nr:2,5-diamino-6-(ribosylamino)-4(3H)-pyrimidinone 5'-phosphate reductase [Dispira simplex]